MAKTLIRLLSIWVCASLAVARPDTNLPYNRELTNRAHAGMNLLSPPSFPPYTYVGCFQDTYGPSPAPILSGPSFTSTTLTYQTCATFCASYKYFGVEFGNTCKCGNSLPPTTLIPPTLPVPDLLCNIPCSGDENEACGATGLLTIFRAPGIISSSAAVSSPVPVTITINATLTEPSPTTVYSTIFNISSTTVSTTIFDLSSTTITTTLFNSVLTTTTTTTIIYPSPSTVTTTLSIPDTTITATTISTYTQLTTTIETVNSPTTTTTIVNSYPITTLTTTIETVNSPTTTTTIINSYPITTLTAIACPLDLARPKACPTATVIRGQPTTITEYMTYSYTATTTSITSKTVTTTSVSTVTVGVYSCSKEDWGLEGGSEGYRGHRGHAIAGGRRTSVHKSEEYNTKAPS